MRIDCAVLLVLVFAALAACADESASLSIEEGLKCANEAFKGHSGGFSLGENAIAYSYESPNGPAKVIVVFERRRPVRTSFESVPHGSHPELACAWTVVCGVRRAPRPTAVAVHQGRSGRSVDQAGNA